MFVSVPFPNIFSKPLPAVSTRALYYASPTAQLTAQLEAAPVHVNDKVLYENVCLQDDRDRNARTRGQFKPRNANKGTSSYQLRQFAEATLGSGSLRKTVKLPEGEDLNEWLAVNGERLSAPSFSNFQG